jgi:formylglycine-generating enzyme required for sulfatase activity
MNRARIALFMVGMLLFAACAPAATPTPGSTPPTAIPSVPTSLGQSSTPASTPISLAGPPMQVGSTFLYFDGTVLVAVPAGPFVMGHGGLDNPVHTVTLGDYWIYATKVTNQQYKYCVALHQCDPPDQTDNRAYSDLARQNDPVVGVTYAQAAAYCSFVHGNLPTEAQWEKAARGPNGNLYPWGNGAPSNDLLNFDDFIGHTTNVINYPQGKSFYDALEMEGNTFEWAYDWYDPNYYSNSPSQDPLGPVAGKSRSVRSASFRSGNNQIPSSTRSFELPQSHTNSLGFRCVVLDPTYFAPLCTLAAYVGPDLNGGPGSIQPDCPQLGVTTESTCGPDGFTKVTFTDDHLPNPGDPSVHVNAGSCTQTNPGGWPAKYVCTNVKAPGFDVSITSKCAVQGSFTPTCPAHYNLSNGSCVWDGSGTAGTQCPAGTEYDPNMKCCTSVSGTGTNFSACPVGSVYSDGSCVPNSGLVNPASAHIDPPAACNQGGSCNMAPAQAYCAKNCRYGCTIDPNTCQVTYCNAG